MEAFDPDRIPAPVRALVDTLLDAGFEAVLVGGCVRDLLRGAAVGEFDVATSAPAEAVLARFARAVPIGLRHGTVMVPTAAGNVDVTHYRAGGALRDDLAHRDLTVNAMAYDLRADRLVDPFDGAADLAARRLRAVGAAAERLAEDPLRALRAVRFAAQLGFDLDRELEAALAGARDGLRQVARERIRHELQAILLSERAGEALTRLREAGLEADWVPLPHPRAPARVDALPHDLLPRLLAWFGDTPAHELESRLQWLRFPRALALRASRLRRLHPVDASADPERPVSVRRLMQRADAADLALLFALRAAELRDAGEPRDGLDRLHAAIEHARALGTPPLHREDLALDGADVMRLLDWPPGPRVGEALEHLTECALEDPACNTAEALGERLRTWAAAR